jgi:hypothetical protein
MSCCNVSPSAYQIIILQVNAIELMLNGKFIIFFQQIIVNCRTVFRHFDKMEKLGNWIYPLDWVKIYEKLICIFFQPFYQNK